MTKMKHVIILLSSAVLLVAFNDKSQNSFSQQAPKAAELSKAKVIANVDSMRLVRAQDSLRSETEKTKVIVAETEAITEESKQLTQDLLINKDKHIAVKRLADQTLKVAVYKTQKIPMTFVVAPRKKDAVLPVDIKPKTLDSLIVPETKRTFFDKVFFRKRKK